MKEKRILGMLLALLICMTAVAQNISMKFKNESLPAVFKRLEKTTDYRFVFVYNDVNAWLPAVPGTSLAQSPPPF